MKSEAEIFRAFVKHHTDKSDQGYSEFYEILFNKCSPSSILEIGIRSGKSLLAFKHLFPQSRVVGVDIDCKQTSRLFPTYDKLGIEYYECDATKPSVFEFIGKDQFDIIIDDGSHYYQDQIDSFNLLKDKVKYFYVIEDLRWRKQEVIDNVIAQGFKVVVKGTSLNPPRKVNKQFLETNCGEVFCPIRNKMISGLYDTSGEQVEVSNDFVAFTRC